MKMMRLIAHFASLCLSILFLGSRRASAQQDTLVDLIVGTPGASTLVDALVAAGLTGTLSGPGPFTVFGPEDPAFVELGTAAPVLADALFNDPAWILHLQDVLLYHVVVGNEIEILDDAPDSQTFITMANEEDVLLTRTNNVVTVEPALAGTSNVVDPNVFASNGVAHLIDSVLLPNSIRNSIVDLAISFDPEFSTLVDLVVAAGLTDILDTTFGLTVFAPTNAAFEQLPKSTADFLTSPQGASALEDTLLYHVIPEVIPSTAITGHTSKETVLEGTRVNIKKYPLAVYVNRSKVIATDALANNGIIHVIDAVLIPPSLRAPPKRPPPRNVFKGKGYYYSKGKGYYYSKGKGYYYSKGKGYYYSKGKGYSYGKGRGSYYQRGYGGYHKGKGYYYSMSSKSSMSWKSKKMSKGGYFWRE